MKGMDYMTGTVYWITGLSGAGKTTIGTILYRKLRNTKTNIVFLDGDVLRKVFGDDMGYNVEDRHRSAMRNARLCQLLSKQTIDVICCTISMFDDVRMWNRENIKKYREIYLKVSEDVLISRNQKGLYDSSKDSLVGFGVSMEEPKYPDIIIENNGTDTPEEIVQRICEAVET